MALAIEEHNHWRLAHSRLSERHKKYIDLTTTIGPCDVLDAVEDRKRESEKRQWVITTGSKQTLKIRDVFVKIAKWIERFIEVGDVAVQYDPVHVALPWAAIRFILKTSVDDVATYSVVCEGIETISNLMTQCHFIETLQDSGNTGAISRRNECLVAVYTSMLGYLAKAMKFYTQGTIKRIAKGMASFTNKYQALLEKIKKEQTDVDYWVNLLDTEINSCINQNFDTLSKEQQIRQNRLQDALKDLKGPIYRIENQTLHTQNAVSQLQTELSQIHDGLQENERQKILKWLSTQPYIAHHDEIHRKVIQGTGTWLVSHLQFLEWQRSSASSILWLHGIPGSGKSCLSSVVVSYFLDQFLSGRNPRPCYFYCNRNAQEKERSNPVAILGSIARQMSCLQDGDGILQPARELYEKRKQQGFTSVPPTLRESIELIIAMASNRPITTIILDALDECEPNTRSDLLDAFQEIITRSVALVKVFIASRDDLDIVLNLKDCPNLEVEASRNSADIERFIDTELERRINNRQLLAGKPPVELVSSITSALRDGAKGMFRWVELQLQYICGLKTKGVIQKRLGKLPDTLKKIYQDLYELHLLHQEEEQQRIAEGIFRWLLCAQEAWTTDIFLLALSRTYDEDEVTLEAVIELTFNLVIHDKELDIFRFAHLSVREFLEGNDIYLPSLNHTVAATTCLSILSSNNDELDDAMSKYAMWYWAFHAEKCDLQSNKASVLPHLSNFLDYQITPAFCEWSRRIDRSTRNKQDYQMSSIERRMRSMVTIPPRIEFSFCVWDLGLVLTATIDATSVDTTLRNVERAPMLHTACQYSQIAVVESLLLLGANASESGGKYGNALQAASSGGHNKIVEMLLSKGADVNTQGGEYGNALQAASYLGHDKIVEMLLSKDADVNAQGGYYGNALYQASYEGHDKIVELLLSKGADVNIMNRRGFTPLYTAIQRGHQTVIEMLVQYNASIDWRDSYGWTPMHWAAYRGSLYCIELLTTAGGDSYLEDTKSWTPYNVAQFTGQDQSVLNRLVHGKRKGFEIEEGEVLRGFCDSCSLALRGSQHHCTICPEFDLCFRCILDLDIIHPQHTFITDFTYK